MKVLLVMEYDLPDDTAAIVPHIMDNLSVGEEGVRPDKMHVAVHEPAYKILSVLQAEAKS